MANKKKKAKTSTKKNSLGKTAKNTIDKLTGKKGSGNGKRRKKGAGWYAREIERVKLKRKYDKLRLKF